MSAVPEVKRFDPHQPRDRKGRWVETGAEVRNSITRALGTVTRVIRGDNFHENSYEVRTSDGQTQHWETSAIDVVRNRDGSAPGLHKPGTAPVAPGAHPVTPAARSAAAGAIGEVYAGQAPDKPQAGHSPVDHAVDAVYGQPHPDRPARVADAVGNVYAAQAPDKPEAGRSPVSHAVDATHGTPAAPAARPDLGGAINTVYGTPVRPLPARGDFTGASAWRNQLGDHWNGVERNHPHTSLSKLQPGDRIHTFGAGTQASPVALAKPNATGVIPENRRRTRTVAHVQRNPDSTHTVHFTDGTSTGTEGGSNIPVSDTGRSRVYAADAADPIVAGGGRPPAPAPGPDVTPPAPDGGTPDVTPPAPDVTPPAPARTAPEVPDGPLADPARSALAAIAGTNGVSDQDLTYYGQRFGDLTSGTLTRDEAHARVEDARNSIINTTDGGDRASAMLALDNLDTAIDAHGGPDPLAGFGTAREVTQNDRFTPATGTWVDIPAAGRRPAVTGIVGYGGRTNASGARLSVRQDDGTVVDRQVKPGESYRLRATPTAVENEANWRVRGMDDTALAAEVSRITNPETAAPVNELAALLARREQIRTGALDAGPPRQAEVTPLWTRADDAMHVAADRARTPEDRATLLAASTAFKDSLEEAGYDAPSAEARTLPARMASMTDAEVLALNERATRYDGSFPDDAIEFVTAELERRGYSANGTPDVGSRVGMTAPQHPSDALVGQRVAYREEAAANNGGWTVGTLTRPDAEGNYWLENGDGEGVNSGVHVAPDHYVEVIRPDDPRVDRLDPTEMTTPELAAAITRQQARTADLARASGVDSSEFRDANSTLQDMAREHDSRPADPFAPVDPGGTGALFGDGATPDVPAGKPVAASDLAVGDQISYTTADNIVVSGEIEGLHTAGPNVVATLRMSDDSRETRAFKRDAEVNRTAAAAPPVTEDAPARDLRMGQRVLLQDALGAYRPATIIHVTRDPGGSGLVMEVARDDGTHETTIVDPSEVLPRITDATREPDLPPMPDPAPEDGTKFASGLQPGDRIASYGDNITVVRARVAADGLVHARVRLANGAEDDVTYTPDATITLADPPSTVDITPHTAGTATTRPTLYTYQRNGIVALNLDAADSAQPPLVQQAAARVRNRQVLSEEQSAALADALRAQATAPGVRAPRQRTLQRQAAALDAAAAAAGGRVPPVTPNRDTVEKTRPANLVAGDWVALRGQGAAGGVDVVQVLDSRAMMGGRLHELTVRDADGNQSRRLVAGNADTYLLPDLPRDLPAGPEQPRPEHVTADRVTVGDTIRFTYRDPATYQSSVREAVVTGAQKPGGEGTNLHVLTVDVNGAPYEIRTAQRSRSDGGGTVIRTARGPASQDQAYDSLLPAENPEVLRDVTDVAVGDRVSVPAVTGVDHVGVVHAIEKVATDDGTPGIRVQLRQDNGDVNTVVIFNDDPAKVTRLAKGDEGAAQRIQQMYAERERQLLANAARTKIEGFRSQILTYEVRPNPYGTPEDAAAGVERGRDDPGAHPSRNIRTTAKEIAEYLAPDGADEGQRALIADRVEPILRQVREEYLTNLAESLRQVPADQTGINNSGWVQRVIDQHRQSPSTRDFGRISRTLADAAASLQGGGDSQQGATPDFTLPEGADLATRMRAYREAIGGNGQGFGKTRVTRTVFKAPTLDDLEAGRVPETEAATTFVSDRAADGGPGEVAMRHHDVLLAAGRDLDAEVQRRIVARDSSLGANPEATLADLKAQVKEASEANGAAWNAYFNVPRDDLDARAQAREAMDSAAARSKEVNDRYQKMNMRLSRLRREVAMEIIAEHRQVGGVELGWVNNKGELLTNRSKLVKAMRSAEAVYPAEWLQAFKDRTRGKFLLKSSKRGHFVEGREITLSDKAIKYEGGGPQDDVAVHELGHGMEWVVPGLAQAEEAFLWARTSDGPVGSRTRQKQSAIYTGSKEYGFKDDFPEHYTGKTYSDGGKYFEVFTTSVESVFAGSPYADEGMRAFTLGSMILL